MIPANDWRSQAINQVVAGKYYSDIYRFNRIAYCCATAANQPVYCSTIVAELFHYYLKTFISFRFMNV